jgi:outer membrane receptor for ferrienterochelin and colicins
LQSNLKLSGNLLLVNGFELNKSMVNSNIFGSPESFGAGVYSQGELSFSFPLLLTLGLRYDYNRVNNQQHSQALSPKLGFNYKFSESFALRGMLGTGFRSPSLAEKFTSTFISGIRIKPNPEVEPESNITFETGILYQHKIFTIDAAVFRNEYYDMIEPAVDTDGQIFFTNLIRARIQGFELNISPRLTDQIKLNFNYTFMDARDRNNGKYLKYRPQHLFYSGLSYSIESLETGINFRYWSRVKEIDNELVDLGLVPDGDKRVPVYVVDLNAGYNFLRIGFPGRVYLNFKNILNYNYIEIIGNIAPLRNIALSFEIFI